jgi:hypothetical protein
MDHYAESIIIDGSNVIAWNPAAPVVYVTIQELDSSAWVRKQVRIDNNS